MAQKRGAYEPDIRHFFEGFCEKNVRLKRPPSDAGLRLAFLKFRKLQKNPHREKVGGLSEKSRGKV